MRPEILATIVSAARTGSVIPYKALVEGYTTCMKRIIKFASQLDFFQSFSAHDQRCLLLNNTDMVVNIRSARLLRPGINLTAQLNHVVAGENPACKAVDVFRQPERLEYRQVVPYVQYMYVCISYVFVRTRRILLRGRQKRHHK